MIGDAPLRRRKKAAVATGAPAWMATFADLATILLSFFVLLLSFSELDVEKYKQVAGSLRNAFGVQRVEYATDVPKGTSFIQQEFDTGPPQHAPIERIRQMTTSVQRTDLTRVDQQLPLPMDTPQAGLQEQRRVQDNLQRLQKLLADEIEEGLVEVKQAGMRIIIRIRERGSFATGSAKLIEPFQPVVDKLGRALAMANGGITIAGHTDNVPIRNDRFRSNWALSAARAVTMYHRLAGSADIDARRVTVEGHADTRPVAANKTAPGRAKNRRVELILKHGSGGEVERSVGALLSEAGGEDHEQD